MATSVRCRWPRVVERGLWALLVGAAAWACSSVPTGGAGPVRVVGSDTMLALNRRLAQEFMEVRPGAAVLVAGGGTGIGVAALVAGEADICAASRPLRPEEVSRLHECHGTLGVRFLVAQDALSVYVNPANPIRDLGMAELRGLFTGELRSWAEVGGPDRAVEVISRPPTSGTHHFFREHVLEGRPYASTALTVARTRDVLAAVRMRPGAVGYGGLAHADGPEVRRCMIDGTEATAGNVALGRYPLSRYLAFYTVAPPRGRTRELVDWVLGPEGQATVGAAGYIPLWIHR